jgi:[histone H3]-lysine36 N-trimethyltransferase
MTDHSSPTKMKSESPSLGGPAEDSATFAEVKLEVVESKPTPPGPVVKLEPMSTPKDEDVKPTNEDQSPKAEAPASPPTASKPVSTGPQLIGDLPRAEAEALRTFVEISENHYQYGTLGRSREALESMICDCQYEHGQSDSFVQ